MYAKHPELAKKFQAETPKGADLPEHVKKRKDADQRMSKYMNDRMRAGH